MNEKIFIKTDDGLTVEAQAPVIISASRSTDIPAFYSKWFNNRLNAGYMVWVNPFNQKPMYISFKNCKVVVFWTKNPKPIMPLLKELDSRSINYYFQYTLNDYEKEGFEQNIPKLQHRIEIFKALSNQIGKQKVIWRYDPLILTSQLRPKELLNRILNIGNQIMNYTNKLVFSFVDINNYRKVQNNLIKETPFFNKETIGDSEFSNDDIIEIASGLSKIQENWKNSGWDIELATCAENIDLGTYNIKHNRCIDADLMKEIFSQDKDLVYYLNFGKFPELNTLFQNDLDSSPLTLQKLKDKGQRKECGCMISKDIGMYNTCSHFCVYCYANTSKELVQKNLKLHDPNFESIIRREKF